METNLVKIIKEDLFVGTWDLSQGFDIEHRIIKRHIQNFKEEFERFGDLKKVNIHCLLNTMNIEKKRGGQVEQYLLNHEQYVFLGTLLSNTKKAIEFKVKLTEEFFRMRKVLMQIMVQRQNQEWQERRKSGIVDRREATDAIQDLAMYAKENGSKNYKMYYVCISKMQNKIVLGEETKDLAGLNIRDCVDRFSLNLLTVTDRMIAVSIAKGIKNQVHYKDIYKDLFANLEAFAMSMGRTPLLKEIKKRASK